MQIAKCKLQIGPRLTLLLLLAIPGLLFVSGCAKVHSGSQQRSEAVLCQERWDGSLAAATKFLIDHQDADGAWRSDTYGVFKDGPSLTPLVLETLLGLPSRDQAKSACRRGAKYLAALVRADGTIDEGPRGLTYPVYTAAYSVRALSQPQIAELGDFRHARDTWLQYLRQRQLTEELGWQPADKQYGGWGYSNQIPRKPKAGEPTLPLTESNLSATIAALEALQAAGCSTDDPAFKKALIFVKRCQNFPENADQQDPAFDDGGFFFIYDDPVRNKAGLAGKDRHGRERFASYGSATADGLRALLVCGLPSDHPRVQAAWRWLETHFDLSLHPGNYATDREVNRQAVYLYYSLSLAKALRTLTAMNVDTRTQRLSWPKDLTETMVRLQTPDGSWTNKIVLVREDDPLVATCCAVQTIAVCRSVLEQHPGFN
jgi:squalene-hopene/tetraprenyl-beta-curcumene cyclase